jgi:paraquat-inducible protein A
MTALTARAFDLILCESCGLLSRGRPHADGLDGPVAVDSSVACPRCGARLHVRKPDSVARTWAYLISALVLYVPANALPIMRTSGIYSRQSDTILSGVAYLWNDGSWGLALIVFIASVAIPLVKLFALSFLLVTVQRGSSWRPRQRTRLFRMIASIGRWSMLDIYVVALLAALVRVQPLALIDVGPGAVAFGAMVVLTMFATHAFDPRLIWDGTGRAAADQDDDDD